MHDPSKITAGCVVEARVDSGILTASVVGEPDQFGNLLIRWRRPDGFYHYRWVAASACRRLSFTFDMPERKSNGFLKVRAG